MPKTKQSATNRLNSFVLEYGTGIFKTDGSILFCELCEVKVNSDRKFVVTQHVNTEKHKRAVIRKNEKNKNSEIQQLVANTPKKCLFSHDLCKALLSANIPLYEISNPQLKSFLEKYTSREIPSDSTLRKTYVNDIYEETMKNIREQIKGNKIWVSIDETTDSEGRYVTNVIIGTLNTDAPGKTYLLTTEVLEKANNSTIVKLFDHSMFVLWPNGIRYDDVLLFVTDAAPYMVKAGQTLQSLYSKMIHLTCLAHGIHRVAENIREKFEKVDKLNSRVKQVFLKAPSRVLVFKSEAPAIPLPPEPILTRWGTWIIAASYYCKYYQVIRRVLLSLNAEDAISVKKAQQLIQEPDMEANLVYIHSNFGFIPECITKLETQYISLSEALSAVKYVQNKLNDCEGEIGVAVFQKLNNVLEKNCDFKTILKISKILSGQESSMEGLPDDLTGDDITYFKYAPITSTDVERSFSRYKTLLVDNRRSFNFENIKKSLVVQCNTFEESKEEYDVDDGDTDEQAQQEVIEFSNFFQSACETGKKDKEPLIIDNSDVIIFDFPEFDFSHQTEDVSLKTTNTPSSSRTLRPRVSNSTNLSNKSIFDHVIPDNTRIPEHIDNNTTMELAVNNTSDPVEVNRQWRKDN
ncbi:hypothetical protein QTP88_011940 [Uroleucon formosanum]